MVTAAETTPSVMSAAGHVAANSRWRSFSGRHSLAVLKWHARRDQHSRLLSHTARSHTFRIIANPNVSSAKGDSNKEVIMVDPLEAKRLAAEQMKQIQAKEKLKRRRQIEAINGAWAMIGLTAGLVIEGQTGKGILDQLGGYWNAIFSFFMQ